MKKTFSYSEFRTFLNDKNEYYLQYILGQKPKPNKSMKLGSIIHRALADNAYLQSGQWKRDILPEFTPSLYRPLEKIFTEIPRYQKKEQHVSVGWNDTTLYSIYDGINFFKDGVTIADYKTCSNFSNWQQKDVDSNEQLTFYALVWWLKTNRLPKKMQIIPIQYNIGKYKIIETIRNDNDIARMITRIQMVIYQLKELGWWEKRL